MEPLRSAPVAALALASSTFGSAKRATKVRAHGTRVPTPAFHAIGGVLLCMVTFGLIGGCNRASDDETPTSTDVAPDSNASGAPAPGSESTLGASGDSGADFPNSTDAPGITLAPKVAGTANDDAIRQAEQEVATGLHFPAEGSDEALVEFIASADEALGKLFRTPRTLVNSDPLNREILRVAKLKQTAAEQLLDTAEQEDEFTFAIRTRLQAISHQAATGNVQAANELETYAFDLINHADKAVQLDSRTTLVALAVDRLKTGLASKPDDVLRFAKQLTTRPDLVDVASIKVIEHAVNALAQYNYPNAAEELRQELAQTILNSPNPAVQEVGAQIVANFRFAALESLRNQIADAKEQRPEEWQKAADEAAAASQDPVTLRYLATLALQLESMEFIDNARAIYDSIRTHFGEADNPELRELARQAIYAFEARQNAIDRPFPPHPAETSSGRPFRIEDYQNEILLFVFWSTDQPDSMAGLAAVEVFAAQSTKPLRIIGVNCESTDRGRAQAKQLIDSTLEFPNLMVSAEEPPRPSKLETSLGIVSYPTVVVVGPQAEVVKVVLGSDQLDAAIASIEL